MEEAVGGLGAEARPDNAADAQADEGSEAGESDSDAEADQADRWARGRNALRARRRRGLLRENFFIGTFLQVTCTFLSGHL